MAIHARNAGNIADAVAGHARFTCGNVSGQWYDTWRDVPRGQFNGTYDSVGAVYVVFSYRTPIAMYSPVNGWTVPDARYSATTTNHQSVVATGIRSDASTYGVNA